MPRYELSEPVFISLEGEGPLTGMPTVYVRFARCNLKCPGFNNPGNLKTDNGYARLRFDPLAISSIDEITKDVEITMGCDTQYGVNTDFRHMWKTYPTVSSLTTEILDILPNNYQRQFKQNTALSLTGGEPTLRHKTIPALLSSRELSSVDTIIVETNCTVNLPEPFIAFCNDWSVDSDRQWVWSNSPKLSNSGESIDLGHLRDVALQQLGVTDCLQYFKFVTSGTKESIAEIIDVVEFLEKELGTIDVYLMPEACTNLQQKMVDTKVADLCIELNYKFSYRLQNTLWENSIGK